MLRNAKTLESYALRAHDGLIGHVRDFYFDDHYWNVRYFVVQTGAWLTSRNVLISPEAVDAPEWDQRIFPVDLTREQVRSSPGIDTDKPVSRQHEEDLRSHYGWPVYWGGVFREGGLTAPIVTPPPTAGERPLQIHRDPHLRSVNDTAGHHIEATDGPLGHVEDFIIDDATWGIHYLVIDTRNWWPGKKVVVSPTWIREVSWTGSRISVDRTREMIKESPPYDPSQPVTPDYTMRLHAHYGRPPENPTSVQADRDAG